MQAKVNTISNFIYLFCVLFNLIGNSGGYFTNPPILSALINTPLFPHGLWFWDFFTKNRNEKKELLFFNKFYFLQF